MAQPKDVVGAALVVGGGIAGVQASLDLAESGYKVYLVESQTGIGGRMAQLDKTFPTNDCSTCIFSPKLVAVGQNPNIELLSYSEVDDIQGTAGRFKVRIKQKSRYVRRDRCKACGDCATACPVKVPNAFDQDLSKRSAAYRLFPQTIPQTFVIDKVDRAPCVMTCPAHINVQGYVALIGKGKYKEAVELIYQNLPLPGVLGRVCPHPCEKACRRAEKDQPISICKLKRYAADQVDYSTLAIPEITPRDEKVAIIGSGPAGLSAAYYLALKGYKTSILEAAPVLGGWLRVGIPEYRLPRDILEKEINHILSLGVEAKTNTALGKDLSIDDLKNQGFKAVFLAVGCQKGAKLAIPGEDASGVIQGVDFLKDAALGKKFEGIKKAVVIGGGNVAVDAARTLVRLGAESTILYRRSRAEMPAFEEEVHAALDEGVKIEFLAAPVEVVVSGGKVTGLKAVRMQLGEPDASGRRRPVPMAGSEYVVNADTIIPAIGQMIDPGLWDAAGALEQTRKNTIECDKVTFATSIEGVFAGGDAVSGPATVVEAVAAGKEVAESIHRYINGMDLTEGRPTKFPENPEYPPISEELKSEPRAINPEIPASKRKGFDEVELALAEEEAQREANRCLNCGVCSECMECVKACPAQAIDHSMEHEFLDVEVGSVILSTGYEMIDPSKIRGEFSYGTAPNVLTNMEFERMLSASGPNAGEVKRPSDGQHPKKVAWIQCVGSRDSQKGMPHCSSICCMASIKEAVIAKEHDAHIEPTIFYMDIRAYGKDFDAYYERAKNSGAVRFVRSMVSRVVEDPLTHNLQITFLDEEQKLVTETFDMVVLAVGLKTSEQSIELANRLGISLNESKFCATSSFEPVSTNQDGIFVAGMFQGPKDIPQTVMEASAAAGASSKLLTSARNTLATKQEFPPQRDVSGEEPRIGVFICRCGINIANVVDVPRVVEHVRNLPNVVFADEKLFTCSQDTQEQFLEIIKEHNLNRVVVSACSPRTHEPMFQLTMEKAGLNPYLFTMTNIRDQCSWVHASNKPSATEKAMDLARMAIARARRLAPLQKSKMEVVHEALVLGGGVSGMAAALNLGDQGFEVYLVEKTDQLGGNALYIERTIQGEPVRPFVDDLVRKVENHPKITVFKKAQFTNLSGHVGHFKGTILNGDGNGKDIEFGAAIIATGAVESKPKEYLFGESKAVETQHSLEQRILAGDPSLKNVKNAVFIQCVGSRDEERPYCSKVCCSGSVRLAGRLREINPDVKIYILFRDLRTYGLLEKFYTEARKAGAIFVRFDPENKPVCEVAGDKIKVTVKDPALDQDITIMADLVTLAAAIDPAETNKQIGQLFKVTVNSSGYFVEAHMKLRPVDFTTEGVFMCGLSHYPKPIDESIAQATAAAQRASILVSQEQLTISGVISKVDPEKCAVCLTCVRLCPYGAPFINEDHKAEIVPALCQGCGICSSVCPGNAIDLQHFRDDQVFAEIDALLLKEAS
ncbi:MAG: FAD-dependent oxidoreductase [Deltaproteobacteria bacterium]|nr:FAD-dependent oxidoreductase [Deltaproteobacteria bacterium]